MSIELNDAHRFYYHNETSINIDGYREGQKRGTPVPSLWYIWTKGASLTPDPVIRAQLAREGGPQHVTTRRYEGRETRRFINVLKTTFLPRWYNWIRLNCQTSSCFWPWIATGYNRSQVLQGVHSLPNANRGQDCILRTNYQSHLGQTTKEYPIISGRGSTRTPADLGEIKTPQKVPQSMLPERTEHIALMLSSQRPHSSRTTMKGAKYCSMHKRSYVTKSKSRKDHVAAAQIPEKLVGFDEIAKHYIESYQKPGKPHYYLRRLLKLPYIWYTAYGKISKNKGSLTPGPDGATFDGITKNRLEEMRDRVIRKEYEWKGTRRVLIPKPGKPEKRPLGIPSTDDRIVQEVIRMILSPIFEAQFKKTSHGFRPGRSCHTAIKMINTSFRESRWIIEGDIAKYFDTINHGILMDILKKRGIRDGTILKLVESSLKSTIHDKHKITEPILGAPQGGILSPLLSNVYLHELDEYMDELGSEFNTAKTKARVNLAYTRIRDREGAIAARKRRIPHHMPNDPQYKGLKYCRYADDFVIGVNGSRKDAEFIKEKVKEFLKTKLKIQLSEEKTKITSFSNTFTFLGYRFGRAMIFAHVKSNRNNQTSYKKRTKVIYTRADLQRVVKRLRERGFCDGKGMPTPPFRFLQLPQSETNLRVNAILRGLCEWWKLADDRSRAIGYISYLMRYALAKLYATKFKMNSIGKVFERGGKDLARSISSHKKSAVGVTEKRILEWRKSVTKGTHLNKEETKEIKIPAILYSKSGETPKGEWNRETSKWEPDHEKIIRKGQNKKKPKKSSRRSLLEALAEARTP